MLAFLAIWAGAAEPSASVAFAFEPHFANVQAMDERLEAYGYAGVGKRFVPHYGVRGVLEHPDGLRTGLAASAGFTSHRADGNPVPTTTSWTKVGAVVGYRAHRYVALEADAGFGALTHTVGSETGGGALRYLGPYGTPRVDVVLVEAPAWLALGAGWMLHLPVSRPHRQPLWEEPFTRSLVQGPVLSIQSGMGTR